VPADLRPRIEVLLAPVAFFVLVPGLMFLRRLVILVVVLLAPLRSPAQDATLKKGWGGDAAGAGKFRAHWYYNWGPHGKSSEGLEFVPMVKGKHHVTPEILNGIKASGAKVLLGFNEPERESQGNTTVEQALDLWPKLMETGLRLGSPAPSSDGGGMAWLDRFMQGVEKRKLRVDFIAIHWYRSADPRQFEEFLKELNRKYRRPVWVTEFNAQYSGGDRDRFASSSFKICERLKCVERYSYFTAKPGAPGSLWKAGGRAELSPLGEIYRAQ
jgi:hypothetical protein